MLIRRIDLRSRLTANAAGGAATVGIFLILITVAAFVTLATAMLRP